MVSNQADPSGLGEKDVLVGVVFEKPDCSKESIINALDGALFMSFRFCQKYHVITTEITRAPHNSTDCHRNQHIRATRFWLRFFSCLKSWSEKKKQRKLRGKEKKADSSPSVGAGPIVLSSDVCTTQSYGEPKRKWHRNFKVLFSIIPHYTFQIKLLIIL